MTDYQIGGIVGASVGVYATAQVLGNQPIAIIAAIFMLIAVYVVIVKHPR